MIELEIGTKLILKKIHPCGSHEWQVFRLGSDIGLKCLGCDRRVIIPRSRLERLVKKAVP